MKSKMCHNFLEPENYLSKRFDFFFLWLNV